MTELREQITLSDRWYRGFHKVFEYVVTDRAGVVVDISGFTAFTWGIYEEGASPPATPLFPVKTLGAGIAVVSGVEGLLQVTSVPGDTASGVPAGKYTAQLSGTDAAGITDVLVQATAVLRQSPA